MSLRCRCDGHSGPFGRLSVLPSNYLWLVRFRRCGGRFSRSGGVVVPSVVTNMDKRNLLLGHLQEVKQRYNVIFYSLKGSQNYGLDNESSDVDSYFVVMPKLEDLALSRPPISTSLLVDAAKNEFAEIKDVRVFFKDLCDAKPQPLEAVFSDWFTIADTKYPDPRKLDYSMLLYSLSFRLESFANKIFRDISSMDFSKKRDRKAITQYLVLVNFCDLFNNGTRSFYVFDEERKREILKIKNEQMSKDEFLESGKFSKWNDLAFKTAISMKKKPYSSRLVVDANKMLANIFEFGLDR